MSKATQREKGKASAGAPTVPKSRRLEVVERPGVSQDTHFAELVTAGDATNALTALRFVQGDLGELSLTHMVKALKDCGELVNGGDMKAAERMLNGQAIALNAIFAELARRAHINMGSHLGAMESYLRLALKAQSQSRATLETLAAIKNPPVVYAKQANINNGGQQQVNNGTAVSGVERAGASAQAANPKPEQTELLEAGNGKRLDTRAASKASGAHSHMEAVGAVHGTKKP
ncbi:hypothetical protein [Inhella sp.]|uniref:hypothetical protein n=1 Tax=Inhella sp. TaxID=1921806 RepID=UPI0035B14978